MGLHNKTNDFIFVKRVNKDVNGADTPFWGIQGNVDGEWKIIEEYNAISGELIGIETDDYDYTKGKKVFNQELFILILKDGEELYKVSINYSYMSRGILNSLASIESFVGRELDIALYTNKQDFDAAYVTIDGKKTEWGTDVKLLPAKEDEGWSKSFMNFIDKIVDAIPADPLNDMPYVSDTEKEAIKDLKPPEENDAPTDDLPF